MTVFADAFFWIALLNRRDEYHEAAKTYAQSFHGKIVTTQWVLAEVADAVSASRAREAIPSFFQELSTNAAITIVDASPTLFHRGLDLYAKRPDKNWSLTDCMTFVVMTELGLSEALTGDHHFAQAGFHPVFA